MRRYIAFIIILATSLGAYAADGNHSPTFALSGDVSLLSHYVENGLSQSDQSPALQGSFWFNFGPQFRLGVWGSNTNFDNSDDHFNLRLNADIKVNFTANTHAVISYSESQYYNGGEHNGNILGLHLHFWDYRIVYEGFSNWEATDERSTRVAFGALTTVFGSWKWNNEIGYNTPQVDTINPYFDARTGLGTKWGVIFFEGALTGTSESSQFHGAGDFFFILSAKTEL
ncbi:TorF family putative porin [Bdellovibrio sp. 22V]|uniref:TorF family putative porin n=1 Tax=Bdellovibrio TaxID=958 RepID=UPI0025430800|nr:TorF family putative porin [Bdellovibrio sp. 22V]WII72788.1 TorF family putative porin [Bdellovibrio sp. 22V]